MAYDQNQDGWDRWNSNASNSSYYNQPTHSPYKGRGFEYASFICGLISITAACTGIFSIPIGALGVLFAVLTYRAGKKMKPECRAGIWLSCIGMASGIAMIIFTFATLPARLNDEAFRSQMNVMYQQMFGMDFETFMEEYYGVTFEE
ncbi:MAG TPA: DUF2987 domain-containing protein [Candidatus Acetatifactor stercoripullorum]|uniref:DUF2987 domain-containing protein n=1 Tax=Candidatus Acetatifactor stercoripullorum TaxID=2838414 RepID=A0A9D1R366_9FIRM|nr:hypothetical protein [Candidatus Acetatifactor stercoripullorum]HIW80140.1 DUF2987 domain-containing protein [Candidatus Acetatifactor stercoripullorum]